MTSMKKTFFAAIAVALMASIATPTFAGKGDIAYRQAVMKAVGGHWGAMKTILKGQGGDKKDFAGHAHALNELARVSLHAFPKGSSQKDGKTRALDAIWEKPADFKKVADAFIAETAKLAEMAKAGDMEGAAKQIGMTGKNACGACHKPFRAKKK